MPVLTHMINLKEKILTMDLESVLATDPNIREISLEGQ